MRKPQFSFSGNSAGVLSIILIYIGLMALVVFLFGQILSDVSNIGTQITSLIIPIAIALPVILFAAIIIQIFRLIRDRRQGNPGAGHRIRLFVSFSLIIILSSVPQGMLALQLVDAALGNWFGSGVKDSLSGGVQIALTYYQESLKSLSNFPESTASREIVDQMLFFPSIAAQQLQYTNSAITSIQLFDDTGTERASIGDNRGFIQKAPFTARENRLDTVSIGFLPKESSGSLTFLRYLRTYTVRDIVFAAVFTSILPENFDREARMLTSSLGATEQLEQYRTIFRITMIIFFALFALPILLLSILISFLLSEEIVRPLTSLEEAIHRVAEGDFSFRVLTRGDDDISILAGSFNTMLNELEHSRKKILQTEKVSTWQEIAQRLAHELRNPLTPINLSAQRIIRKLDQQPEEIPEILKPAMEAIIREVNTLDHLLKEFREFAKIPDPVLAPVPLLGLIQNSLSVQQIAHPEITVVMEGITDEVLIHGDRNQLHQVFLNLFKNGYESMQNGGQLTIRADLVKKGNTRYCRIQVQDTGIGIVSANQDKVFHPYFTTKKNGTGLGLPIVERIISDHRGQLWFESEEGSGTTFFIDLPMESFNA